MLEGLTKEEADTFLQENPTLMSLYEIDEAEPYQYAADADAVVVELGRAREAFEQDFVVSQRVQATELVDLNLGMTEEPRNIFVAKELDADFKEQLTNVLQEYKDVFAWSYEDMKGLNPEFYHHKINLTKDTIPVQQRWYRLNPNYVAKLKEEIDKLL
jgi:Asp-tRNA(Asn)/Glu-tRNA(Gln) amidotransferase B subunit